MRFSDLALHDRVNNTSYVRWILEAYRGEIRRSHIVRSLSINCLGEMRGNDVAFLSSQACGPPEMSHTIRRRIVGAEACRAVLSWKESEPSEETRS